jgi:hypothetical protein
VVRKLTSRRPPAKLVESTSRRPMPASISCGAALRAFSWKLTLLARSTICGAALWAKAWGSPTTRWKMPLLLLS